MFSNEALNKNKPQNPATLHPNETLLPGCPNYKRVKIDPRKGEQYFCTEEEAKDAGWEKSAACNNIWQTKE